MINLAPISVTRARIAAMKKGPAFPMNAVNVKKTNYPKSELTQEQKDALQKRLDELTKPLPPKFKTLEEALAHAKKEIFVNKIK